MISPRQKVHGETNRKKEHSDEGKWQVKQTIGLIGRAVLYADLQPRQNREDQAGEQTEPDDPKNPAKWPVAYMMINFSRCLHESDPFSLG